MLSRQDEEARVVREQMQAVVLVAKVPADPAVTRRTLPGRGGKAEPRQPLAAPRGHITGCIATSRRFKRSTSDRRAPVAFIPSPGRVVQNAG
jgi:hypothetical protein